jgi:hypothetical protein
MNANCSGKAPRGILTGGTPALWPNNEVPYQLEGVFDTDDRVVIAAVKIYFYLSISYLSFRPGLPLLQIYLFDH